MDILQDKCLEIFSAENSMDGLKLFKDKNPDIILTSNNFSDLNGSKMRELLQKVGAEKPIVVTSTPDEHDSLINSISLGVKNYLFKPINAVEVLHVLQSIAEQMYIQKQYKETNALLEQYKNAVDYSCIVTKTDIRGNITYVNQQFIDISGYDERELIGKSHRTVRHPDSLSSTFEDLWKTITSKKVWKGIIKNRAKDGSAYTVSATIMPILDDKKEIVEYIAIRQDITGFLEQQDTIVRQTTDSLTQLPNREKLLEFLENSAYPNLALINIDNFRDINDLYSYEVGDRVLVEVGNIIAQHICDSTCTLFKLPSDEFAVLVDTAKDIYSFEETILNLVRDLKMLES